VTPAAIAATTLRPSAALLGAQIALAAAIDTQAVSQTPYDPTTLDLLLRIALSPRERTKAVDLRRQLQLSAGYMSRRINRAEGDRLIAREPDADDRRAQWITLTSSGRSAVEQFLPLLASVIDAAVYATLTASEIDTLINLLGKIETASLRLVDEVEPG